MTDFTASNGITVFVRDGGSVQFHHGTRAESCGILQVMPHSEWWQTLREFFQHERDENLGRWRWPENPNYVVYPATVNSRVRVLRETGMGDLEWVDRGDARSYEFCHAARAYFEAHPERKPWEDASDGDIWELDDTQYLADKGRFFRLPLVPPTDATWRPAAFASNFTTGRLIWSPKETS